MLDNNVCKIWDCDTGMAVAPTAPEARGKQDILTGLVVLGLSAGLLALLPAQVGGAGLDAIANMRSPAFFPVLAGAAMTLLSIALILRGAVTEIRAQRKTVATTADPDMRSDMPDLRWVLLVSTLLFASVISLPRLGYMATVGALMLGIALAFGYRRWWVLIVLCTVTPVVIFVTFESFLRVLLPRGAL